MANDELDRAPVRMPYARFYERQPWTRRVYIGTALLAGLHFLGGTASAGLAFPLCP